MAKTPVVWHEGIKLGPDEIGVRLLTRENEVVDDEVKGVDLVFCDEDGYAVYCGFALFITDEKFYAYYSFNADGQYKYPDGIVQTEML